MTQEKSQKYPDSPRMELVETLHGVEVADPYRWLEELDSEQTRQWIAAQNEVSFAYLGRIAARDKLQQRISTLWDYDKYGLPFKRGNIQFVAQRYFLLFNQNVISFSRIPCLRGLSQAPRTFGFPLREASP